MPDEVPYELSQDQLDWLRLIFAVYSGASVVEDGSRITGEVLQKFYGSWGLEPLAPEANSKLGWNWLVVGEPKRSPKKRMDKVKSERTIDGKLLFYPFEGLL